MNQELKDKRINDLIALFTKGQIDKCIRQGKKVLKMYPNEPFLFNILGITHAAKGLFAESLNYYEKAIDLNPSYFEVFNNMGVAYNDWKKPKEAISCLKKAIGIQPSYAEAFNNMGNSYKELSDFDNAVVSYKKAIDLAPTYTDALCNLGICCDTRSRCNCKCNVIWNQSIWKLTSITNNTNSFTLQEGMICCQSNNIVCTTSTKRTNTVNTSSTSIDSEYFLST